MAEKLTPETEECYKRVPASFPEDWFDWSGPGDQGLKLKKEAPARGAQRIERIRRLLRSEEKARHHRQLIVNNKP